MLAKMPQPLQTACLQQLLHSGDRGQSGRPCKEASEATVRVNMTWLGSRHPVKSCQPHHAIESPSVDDPEALQLGAVRAQCSTAPHSKLDRITASIQRPAGSQPAAYTTTLLRYRMLGS